MITANGWQVFLSIDWFGAFFSLMALGMSFAVSKNEPNVAQLLKTLSTFSVVFSTASGRLQLLRS